MRKAIIICFTTVCMSLAFIQMAVAIGSEEAYRHLEQGNALHKAGKYKQATEEFKAAWEGGKLLDACFNLALTYDRDLNENRLAIKYYNEFLAVDSQSHEAEEVRSLEESARQEITQTGWWFDKQATEQTKKDEEDIVTKVKEFQKASVLADTEGRPEDKITGQGHICFGCHAGFMGPQINMAATHPVGRVPKGDLAKTVPKSVRFYKDGQVICLSCHNEQNLHFEAGTAGINYKYLRVTTGGKEDMPKFCAFCHSSKSARRYLEGEDDSRGGLELRR